MKPSRLYCSMSLLMSLAVFGQTSSEHKDSSITKGACSPIAPNNQGSITIRCVGFSEEQNKQIVNLLHLLSLKQASDQDALLSKMNELLDTVKAAQRQASPRIITEQDRHRLIADETWGMCAPERILITAPDRDAEAQALARQLKDIFDRVEGMYSVIRYDSLPKVVGNNEDFKMVYDLWRDCSTTHIGRALGGTFNIGRELQKNTHPEPPPPNQITTSIYVYRR